MNTHIMLSPTTALITIAIVVAVATLLITALYRDPPETSPSDLLTRELADDVVDESKEIREDEGIPEEDKLPRQCAVLALLNAADGEKIEGTTRMQKLIFLMQEEWGRYSDEPYPFEKYEFEPYDY